MRDRWLNGKLVECEHGFCETCGKPRNFPGAKLCNGCWEVESRLGGYLCNANARRFVEEALEAARMEAIRAQLIAAVEGQQLNDDIDNEADHAYRAAIRDAVQAVRDADLKP